MRSIKPSLLLIDEICRRRGQVNASLLFEVCAIGFLSE